MISREEEECKDEIFTGIILDKTLIKSDLSGTGSFRFILEIVRVGAFLNSKIHFEITFDLNP